ncbi:hypothetical protein MBVG596_1072 [Mycoplasmopsis bovigenitalium]|uniref:hypothetical protein n=1 Tax=Mycoplasmopsis bovigenitalium TaxID=2112 RepID=UPI0009096FF4|nr:hypothetical protein [Mycoplasmopsis bovigenitalium]BAW18550.1 hypothetical protein MBVG596_1072 [Mycoplasmopsis bovigenitalium]
MKKIKLEPNQLESYLNRYLVITTKDNVSVKGVLGICWHSPNLLTITNEQKGYILRFEHIKHLRLLNSDKIIDASTLKRTFKYVLYSRRTKHPTKPIFKTYNQARELKKSLSAETSETSE